MVVFSKFNSSGSSDGTTLKRKYTTTWEAIHVQKKISDHFIKKTSESEIKIGLLQRISSEKKCCCDKCLLTLVEGYGLDLVSRSIKKAREAVYYSNQIVAHTELRSVLEKGFNAKNGSVELHFLHLGVLGDLPSTSVGIKVCLNP